MEEKAGTLRVAMMIPDELKAMTGNAVDVERWTAQARDAGIAITVIRQGAMALPAGTDVVHAIHSRRGGPEALSLCAGRIPLVASVSGSDIYLDYPDPRYRDRLLEVWRGAGAIVTWHQGTADDLGAIDPSLRPKIRPIGPAVRLEEPRRARRESWGIEEDELVVLLPASLRAAKDPLFALPALARVRERFPRIRFVVAGVVRDAAYAPDVRRTLDEHPWTEFVGAVPRPELLGLMQISDVVLNTSPEEGFSNAVLEAMHLGRPLLLRDNDGNRAATREAASTAALYFSTVDELSTELEALMRDRDRAAAIGAAAKLHARERFSERREREAYASIYRAVAARQAVAATG